MNYKVLYRKYRPTNFENVVGQDYITKTLKNSIINGNISHAYIFSGPRGTGKTSTAKIFARAINCLNPKDGSPCGECDLCKSIENPDIIEMDAASNNGVDEIREIINNIKLTPSIGKYKVYIIDEVHMLTTSAFNALLLTLEEPPSHVIFILATTNIENVPITILSRCQRFDFQRISTDEIANYLKEISKKEKIKIDEEALKEIAYLSDGCMRDSLSLLDQLSKLPDKITVELVENQIKTVSAQTIQKLIDTIDKNDIDGFTELLNDFKLRGINYKTLVKKLIDVLSNLAKESKERSTNKRLKFSDYKKLILDLSDCLTKINVNIDAFSILEILLLDFFDLNNKNETTVESATSNSIQNEEIKPVNTSKDFSEFISTRINNCFVNAQKDYLENLKKIYKDVLNSPTINGKIKSLFADSIVVAASDKYAIFTSTNEHMCVDANNIHDEIEDSLSNNYDISYKVVFISEDRWNLEKKKYVENKKKNVKYEFINEKNDLNTSNNAEINDIFNMDKFEVI